MPVPKVSIVERSGMRDQLGEGLCWSARDNAVYWTDILGSALNRLSLTTGEVARWEMPEMLSWVIERENSLGFIAGFRSGFAELRLDPVVITYILDPEPDLPENRMNDAKADSAGRIWAGTMPISCDRSTGAFYRFDHNRSCHRQDSGYTIANGPAFSPDEKWLYHSDTALRRVYRFPLNDDGSLGKREDFIHFEPGWGNPDGMVCDSDGGLWIAQWGRASISRFTPEGMLDRSITLPTSQITNICFAGEELDRMFVTSAADGLSEEAHAGCLFEVDAGVTGLPTRRFVG